MKRISVPTAEAMAALGRELALSLRAGDLVVLVGELGAGKTVLAQGVGAGLKVRGPIVSPTFVLSRVHPSLVGGPALVHVDAYRLGSPEEVDALDLEASLAESVTVVEWGAGLVEHLVNSWLAVTIERSGDPDDETRVVSIEAMTHGESSPTEDETRVAPIEEATRGESTPPVVPDHDENRVLSIEEGTRGEFSPPVVLDHDGTRVAPVEEATRG